MVFPKEMWLFFVVALLCCSIGFKKFVWFMSVGYGLASAGIGLAMLIVSLSKGFNFLFVIQCVLFVIYGIRLGGFLLIRELKSESYRKKKSEIGIDMKVPVFVSFIMWLMMGAMYTCQSAGPIYRLLNGASNNSFLIIGIIVSLIGIIVEALADKQKSDAKNKNPNMPAMDGLYKICRCPNYFGEMLFWTGSILSGIGALVGKQWIIAIVGYVLIIAIMLNGAKRVETRHIKHYGAIKEYNDYADSTPLIFPLIPIYHMTSKEKIEAEEAKKKGNKK